MEAAKLTRNSQDTWIQSVYSEADRIPGSRQGTLEATITTGNSLDTLDVDISDNQDISRQPGYMEVSKILENSQTLRHSQIPGSSEDTWKQPGYLEAARIPGSSQDTWKHL